MQAAFVFLLAVYFVPILSKSNNKANSSKARVGNEELLNISQVLFDNDENNLLSHVQINVQGFLNFTDKFEDRAPDRLLTIDDALSKFETIKRMKMLYDNFERNSVVEELVTEEEKTEESNFIDSLLKTSVMRHAMKFLVEKGLALDDPKEQHDLLRRLWFDFYPRNKNTEQTSSGFEHVFLAEQKRGKIIGLHNWIYFAEAEKQGALNYQGWMRQVSLGDKAKLVKLRFEMNGLKKPVSSIIVGTSPELEISLYTICFLSRQNSGCKMTYDGVPFTIVTHSLDHNGRKYVGSAYVNL